MYIAFCDGATIIIKGKCKGVAIDACAKSEVRMESAISSLEIVNSKRMVCRVSGMVPSIAIDKTDGMNTYLSAEAATVTSFLTSKARARAARARGGARARATRAHLTRRAARRRSSPPPPPAAPNLRSRRR